jgi:hypothetical protein
MEVKEEEEDEEEVDGKRVKKNKGKKRSVR